MGSNNCKQTVLSEWSPILGPFINSYLEKKHQIIDNYVDNTLSNYNIIKQNEALIYINSLDEELQKGILSLSEMAPNFGGSIITFKEEQQLIMLDLMYSKKFISFLEKFHEYKLINFDDNMTVSYDSQLFETNNEMNIIKNIKIVINMKNYTGFVGYEINNV